MPCQARALQGLPRDPGSLREWAVCAQAAIATPEECKLSERLLREQKHNFGACLKFASKILLPTNPKKTRRGSKMDRFDQFYTIPFMALLVCMASRLSVAGGGWESALH